IREVRRLDDKCVAFPMPAGVAHKRTYIRADMGPAVKGYDAGLVNHLVTKDDITGTLHDVVPVVVDNRNHRTEQSTRNASIINVQIIIGIGLAAPFAGQAFTATCFLPILFSLGCESG